VSELLILIEGELAAALQANKSGRLSLRYEPGWRDSPGGYSPSLSMPLAQIDSSHRAI